MGIGHAYTDVLTPLEQQAPGTACDFLVDSVFDDLKRVEKPEDVVDTIIGSYLPQRYLYKYTSLFLHKFTVCLITVAWKLALPRPLPLSSLTEELAVWVIINEAKRYLEDDQVENALEAFIDAYSDDTDVEYLYDDAYDSLDETELAQTMGISSLAFHDWFQPFSDEPSRIVHPYVF